MQHIDNGVYLSGMRYLSEHADDYSDDEERTSCPGCGRQLDEGEELGEEGECWECHEAWEEENNSDSGD